MSEWRTLLAVSRPRSWVQTALPFAAAAVAVQGGLTLAILVGTIYFLAPYNLLLYGMTDDGAVPATQARRMQIAVAATNLPLLIILVILSGAAAGLALALAVGAAIAYSTPPLRTKERPVLDSITRAMQIVLPATAGLLVAGLAATELPWLALLAVTAWAIAAHALGAIGDMARDQAADHHSIATALGARSTAILALVGFGIAAALAATYGPLGALAALALDLYLLLPAMVLLARRGDLTIEGAAARRAWAGFLGLNVLVGGWLILLWLRDRGVTGFTPWEIIVVTASAATAFALANVLVIRVATRRRRVPRDGPDAEIAALTIVVPCRDEAWQLADCLTSLTDQTYADSTILVVDDGSSDGTAEVAAELLGGAGQVIVAPPKPDGWTGKAWACQVGTQASTGELILFVDADTVLVPVAVRILVEQLEGRRLDMLSGLTRYAMPSRGERAAVPGFALLLFGFVPLWLTGLTRGRLADAAYGYGPCLLVRRAAYEATGGHGATPGSLHEDVDLARTFAGAGRRVGTVHAADLGATRHYPDADSAVAAWRRVFLPYAGGSLAVAIATLLVETLAYLVPLLLPLLAFLTGVGTRMLVASFVPLLLLGAMRVTLTLTQRQPVTTILWHPVTIGLTLIGQLAGIVDHVIGRAPRWRGRVLDLPG